MARIKFLDVLEETKQKPAFRSEERYDSPEVRERSERLERPEARESFRDFRGEQPLREYRTPSSLPRENRSPSFSPRKPFDRSYDKEEDTQSTKLIWIGALVLFLAALFFFGGYWAARLQQKMMPPEVPAPMEILPTPLPMDPAPLPEPARMEAPKPIPVIKPLAPAVPAKKVVQPRTTVGKGEYVIQVAAFTQLDKAREYEKKLSEAFSGGENVYISENYMGSEGNEKKIFRVRVRNGFRSEAEAKKVMATITRTLNVADSELRIVKLD